MELCLEGRSKRSRPREVWEKVYKGRFEKERGLSGKEAENRANKNILLRNSDPICS